MGAKVRAAFVICQVAISIVLVVAAGLLTRSFQALTKSQTGMSTRQLLTMEYRLPRNKYGSAEAQAAFHRDLAVRVAQVPGVVSSAIVEGLPFSGNWGDIHFNPAGGAPAERGKEPVALQNLVTPEYFATLGIPLLQGRTFTDHDDAAAPAVGIISRTLAERTFAGQDAVGRTLQLVDSDPQVHGKRITIVGVVGDAKQISLRDSDTAEIYFPYAQQPEIFGTLVVRTAVDPMSLADQVRQAVWSLDKDQPVWKVRTLEFLMQRDAENDRLLMMLMTGFGALAVVLTALGTYGVLSNTVSQRHREIGIRMALGAAPRTVRNMVMRQAMKLLFDRRQHWNCRCRAGLARPRRHTVRRELAGYRHLCDRLRADDCGGVFGQLPARSSRYQSRSRRRAALPIAPDVLLIRAPPDRNLRSSIQLPLPRFRILLDHHEDGFALCDDSVPGGRGPVATDRREGNRVNTFLGACRGHDTHRACGRGFSV